MTPSPIDPSSAAGAWLGPAALAALGLAWARSLWECGPGRRYEAPPSRAQLPDPGESPAQWDLAELNHDFAAEWPTGGKVDP